MKNLLKMFALGALCLCLFVSAQPVRADDGSGGPTAGLAVCSEADVLGFSGACDAVLTMENHWRSVPYPWVKVMYADDTCPARWNCTSWASLSETSLQKLRSIERGGTHDYAFPSTMRFRLASLREVVTEVCGASRRCGITVTYTDESGHGILPCELSIGRYDARYLISLARQGDSSNSYNQFFVRSGFTTQHATGARDDYTMLFVWNTYSRPAPFGNPTVLPFLPTQPTSSRLRYFGEVFPSWEVVAP